MATVEAGIAARHSVRKYKADPVPRELIQQCLEHAVLAPSAMGKSGWQFHVVADPATLQQLNEQTKKPSYGAPVVVFVVMPAGKAIPSYEMYDTALATENLCIAAAHVGLGSVILAYNYPAVTEPAIKKLLGIADGDWLCPCGIALGFPDPAAAATPERKRPVDVVFH